MDTVTGHLTPTPPFDFSQSLGFLGAFAPTQSEQTLAAHTLAKAVSIAGQAIVFQLTSAGDVAAPRLDYTLFSDQPIAEPVQHIAVERMRWYLSLDDDLRPFYALGQADPAFAPILQQRYGYHQVLFLTPFENACWAVLTQRTPMVVARQSKQALIDQYGVRLEVAGTLYQAFPEPAQLAALNADDLAALTGNQRKGAYLRALIAAFSAVDEHWLRTAPYEQVESWLLAINGIGAWSASFVMLRGLGRMEQVPLTEKRLIETVSQRYGRGRALSEREVADIAARYGPWQGYWAHYLRASA
jgi:DNA-3-methyladenine glycosylase II